MHTRSLLLEGCEGRSRMGAEANNNSLENHDNNRPGMRMGGYYIALSPRPRRSAELSQRKCSSVALFEQETGRACTSMYFNGERPCSNAL